MNKKGIPPLLPHQKSGVQFILKKGSCMICDDMGMGKTRTVIEAVIRRGAYPVLVVCPCSLKLNWKQEFKKWGDIDTEIDDMLQDKVVIINYESMKKHDSSIQAKWFQTIIFDESHCLKNEKSQRGKLALKWVQRIPYKILMTGTPMLNRPLELMHQVNILGRLDDVFGGKSKFLKTYCGERRTRFGTTYLGFSNLLELSKKMKNFSIRRTKEDLADKLPPKTIIEVPVCTFNQPLPTSLEEVEELDKQCLAQKYKMCEDFIAAKLGEGERLVVFTHHRLTRLKLLARFGEVAASIYGGQPTDEREYCVRKFQEGEYPLIICSLMASAVGLTLTASHTAIFIEYPWSPTLLKQAQDRIHRLSQTVPVTIYYLYAKGSIDEYRLSQNRTKDAIINIVVEQNGAVTK